MDELANVMERPEIYRREKSVGKVVLALVQLPPPVHGAAVVNMDVVNSSRLNASYRIVTIPIQLSASVEDLHRVGAKKILVLLRNVMRTAQAMRREKPRLVYFALPPHSGGFYANLPLVALAKISGAPLLYHFHGKGVRAAAKSGLYRRLFAWAVKDAHVILVSERLYDDVSDFLARERTFVLPNALIGPSPHPDPSARDGRHILFLSNLIESKGPLVLLDALQLLKRRGIDFHASFAGAPFGRLTRARFEAAIEMRGLGQAVRYLGPVAGEVKQDLLRCADIFAFPTMYENEVFGLVVLEAMAAGLPVVATPEGGVPDMVRDGETGILVPRNNPEKLADALQRLLEDLELGRRMGRRGREIAIRDYAPEGFHRHMEDIWNAVIRGYGSP
jgi:glycosyltransferase involved in cell wall biosynthesis